MKIDFDMLTVTLFIIIYGGVLAFLKIKKKKEKEYLFFFSIFYFYIVGVLKYTQFPIFIKAGQTSDGAAWMQNVNLIPLVRLTRMDLHTSILNVILTIPYGLLMPFIRKMTFKKMLVHGLLFGLAIELIQLLIVVLTNFSFRIFDINDIIFNFIGVMGGFILFLAGIRILKMIGKSTSLQENSFMKYILMRK